ncbi:extracellular catalytic domain type 1 short-chain-length polyhydroxyalkanoate depolymerase [Falsiroseomonas stagni]|nr:PHB depolymerase family esterase [Falsiroseomonas stagni]
MKIPSATRLMEATRLTRAGRLMEATALLRSHLHQEAPPSVPRHKGARSQHPTGQIVDIDPESGAAVGGAGQSGQFLSGTHRSDQGSITFKLYVPPKMLGARPPLIVMLHGCTESPDDFAAGTRMNAQGEKEGCLVVYPCQSSAANAQRCWNWFNPADQTRGQGEPALIAGITRQVMRDHAVDPTRVYAAGLSAGGAAAAIMGAVYPEVYAAIGVHSGLACGAARDLPSAFAAMRGGIAAPPPRTESRVVPTIVFHADRDGTVHPRNGDHVVAQAGGDGSAYRVTVEQGRVPGGHRYSRHCHVDRDGMIALEQWTIHGGGHAWSGGSERGSYTDPKGPDASREMLRFFLAHQHPAPW